MKQATIIGAVLLVVLVQEAYPSPLTRVRRQWSWSDEEVGSTQRPQRPTRPTRPQRPQRPNTSSTTVRNPGSNDQGPTTTTTPSPQYARCISQCLTTSQYNPVCGTNNVTYDNVNKLICAKQCGLDVELLFNGSCNPL